MSNPTFTGTVHIVEDTKTFGQKGFRKRLVVLEQDNGRFTSYVPFEFVQDSCEKADELSAGDEVEMTYKLGGRKWQKDSNSEVKYFLSAEAISFKKLAGSSKPSGSANDAFAEAASEADDDVPF